MIGLELGREFFRLRVEKVKNDREEKVAYATKKPKNQSWYYQQRQTLQESTSAEGPAEHRGEKDDGDHQGRRYADNERIPDPSRGRLCKDAAQVIQILHLVAQNICNNLGYDPRYVHGQLMTFDMVAESHAALLR